MVYLALNSVYLLTICLLSTTSWTFACTEMCDDESVANISTVAAGPNATTVMWSELFGSDDSSYIVQHREENSGFSFVSSPVVSGNNYIYTIEDLDEAKIYEVRVCLVNTSDCGDCLLCFTVRGAPSVPLNLVVTSSSPQSISASWDTPTFTGGRIIDYTVFYSTDSNNLSNNLTINNDAATIDDNILPDTTYYVAVSAKGPIGSGPLTETRSVTTESFNAAPAALLVAVDNQLIYYGIEEEADLGPGFTTNEEKTVLVDTGSFNIIDIDYDYCRGNIYVTTSNSSIIRYNITVTESNTGVSLEYNNDSEVIFNDRGDVRSIAVDWINDVLYWVEFDNSMSQIYSSPLNGGTIKTHGQPLSGEIDSLSVDPIHGYFYWVSVGVSIVHIQYSFLVEADSTTHLPSLYTRIVNGSDVNTFTLDLADSQYYYFANVVSGSYLMIRNGLGNNELEVTVAFPTLPNNIPPLLKTSFGLQAVFTFQNLLVFRGDAAHNEPLGSDVADARMFRSSFQPLPVPPGPVTNIQVFAINTTSAIISWNVPSYSNVFGPDAFSAWEYSIDYTRLGSSETLSFVSKASSVILPSLAPAATYTFTVTARGITNKDNVTTPFTYAFTTFGVDTPPVLLITTDEGVLLADTRGINSRFLSENQRIDVSSGAAYNAHFDPDRYYVTTENGEFYIEDGDSNPQQIDLTRNNGRPMYLQFDWISRRLYWVEEQKPSTIVGVSTVNFTMSSNLSSKVQIFKMESDIEIKGLAMDASNGVLFWVTADAIRVKLLNGLESARTCYSFVDHSNFNVLGAITVDSVNKRIFATYFDNDGQTYVGTLNYTTFSCDQMSFKSHVVQNIVLSPGNIISMAYASNNLFLSQYSTLEVKSLSAEFGSLDNDYNLALGCIRIDPSSITPTQLRALSAVHIDNQPLPDSLPFESTGNIDLLTPPSPGDPALNNDTSNTTFIEVVWVESAFDLSEVFYRVEVELTPVGGQTRLVDNNVLDGTTISLPDQTFSTRVDAKVTPYSLWFAGEPAENSFISPAALPSQVENVRAHVFFPIRNDTTVVSAQIVWDGLTAEESGGKLTEYSINITDVVTGTLITDDMEYNMTNSFDTFYNGPPFFVDGSQTQFTVSLAGFNRYVIYPLKFGREYSVTVNAINPAGAGETSEPVIFNTNVISPPREVLISSAAGGQVINEDDNDNSLGAVTPPITIQNMNRTIYYYNSINHSMDRRSFDNAACNLRETLVSFSNDTVPLSFTFDWIAQTVYVIGRNSTTGTLQIWTVFDLNPVLTLLTTLSNSVTDDVKITAIINPYRGFFQWTQTTTTTTVLYQLNLRDNMVTSLLSPGTKRSIDLSTLEITPALAWDPFTQEVWLCDANTGDIINCNTSSSELTNCIIVVDASSLGVMPTGLPADQIAIDENTIYWSQNSQSDVYYANRTDPTSLATFVSSDSNFVLLSVSPGQQPLPDSLVDPTLPYVDDTDIYCYSPNFVQDESRPVSELVSKTNTTLTIKWDLPSLPSACQDIVFSVLPLTYTVDLESMQSIDVDGYPRVFFETMVTLDDLMSYTYYIIRVEARNRYTILENADNPTLFGAPSSFRTTEGVPSTLEVSFTVYGPRAAYLFWEPLDETELKGDITNQLYLVFLDKTHFNNTTNTFINVTNLSANNTHQFDLSVSNGVLRSNLATTNVMTFLLPPTPVIESITNVSFVVNVTLTHSHSTISSIAIFVDDVERQNITVDGNVDYPDSYEYTVLGLDPYTDYTVYVKGEYASITVELSQGNVTLGPVTDTGEPITTRTATSRPDAPEIVMETEGFIKWAEPDTNGDEITGYTLTFIQTELTDSSEGSTNDINSNNRELDLSGISLREGVTYDLTLVAVNNIGTSDDSNILEYTPQSATLFYQSTFFIIGIAGGGGFLMVVIFVMLIGICCCCCCTSPDKRASFRPDYELIRLREEYAKSRQHAFNPNYMWTRDDYNTYQDDLDNINKFPRSKLRLENFIDRGEFGEVYQGTAIDILAVDSGPTPVAVKTMRKGASHEEKDKFLSEAALMSNFNHQNIVKVLGVCLDNDPLYIIMELMPAGDLLKFLREAKQESGPPLLTLAEQVQVAIDVAQGCRYLEQQHFIHRDIAARNCLVSSKGADRVVKIGDFGLAKDLYTSDYYQVEGQRKLPVRWMAPEALLQGKFASETDIWSYGVLLWEIFTFGNQPYPGRNNQEVLQFVTGGGRLEKPEVCSIRVYKLMQVCWETSPSERLHFAQITEYMAHYLEHVNNKRDSYYSDDEEEEGGGGDDELTRKASRPSRTSSVRSVGLINLARQGSVRIRRSIRGRASLKKEDFEGSIQNHTALNSEENLVDDDRAFRERGPF